MFVLSLILYILNSWAPIQTLLSIGLLSFQKKKKKDNNNHITKII